jgi:hypothetical protein
MFSTFPEDARWNDERQAVEFGVATPSTAGWCGCRSSSFGGCFQSGPPPRRYLQAYYLPTVPVREHRGGAPG